MILNKNSKRIYIFVGAIVLLIIVAWLIIPRILGEKIRHYKQLFLECDGQVLFNPKYEAEVTLPLYFYDETDLSEMADSNNFQKVKVYLADGKEVEATNCEIEDCSAGTVVGNRYHYKQISITFPVDRECEVVACSFEYVDKVEKFNIGNLKVRAYEGGSYLNNYDFSVDLYDVMQRTVDSESVSNGSYNALLFSAFVGQDGDDIQVNRIDIGSDILFMDLSKIQLCGDVDKLRRSSNYSKDWNVDEFAQEESPVLIEKGDDWTESIMYVMPLAVTDEYEEKPRNYYLNPLVYITEKDGTQHVWGASFRPIISAPFILDDTAVEQLKKMIQEDGQ